MAYEQRRRVIFVQHLAIVAEKSDLEAKLISLFERYGPVFSVKLFRTTSYINFENPGDAKRALAGLDGVDFEGKRLRLFWNEHEQIESVGKTWWGGSKGGARHRNRVFVAPLPEETTKQDILYLAWKGGRSVVFVDLMEGFEPSWKIGIMEYADDKDMEYALEWMDGMIHEGRMVRVYGQGDHERLCQQNREAIVSSGM